MDHDRRRTSDRPVGVAGWMRSSCLIALVLGAVSCATVPPEQAGELVIVVDSSTRLARVSFDAQGGLPFTLGDLAPTRYVMHYLLRPGRYCLHSVISRTIEGERLFTFEGLCAEVHAGESTYFGHIVDANDAIERIVDPVRLEADLADPSMPQYGARAGVSRR